MVSSKYRRTSPPGPSCSGHSPKVTWSKKGVSSSGTDSRSPSASSRTTRACCVSERYHGVIADAHVAAATSRGSPSRRPEAIASAKSSAARAVLLTDCSYMACW